MEDVFLKIFNQNCQLSKQEHKFPVSDQSQFTRKPAKGSKQAIKEKIEKVGLLEINLSQKPVLKNISTLVYK
tara:strand:- start:15194 stop:15409 length:216 start_codon:yes stop_codon:yes gene_type:complete